MRALICALGVALLAACGQSAAPPADTSAAPAESLLPLLALQTLEGAPIEGRLSGELGCGFSAGEDQLLLAMGFVASQERAEAVVVRDGELAELQAVEEEGFDGLDDGATFNGDGLSVEITTGARHDTQTEEVIHDATLIFRADGQERRYEGTWTCGP